MNKFKIGDKVRCISSISSKDNGPIKGEEFIVTVVDHSHIGFPLERLKHECYSNNTRKGLNANWGSKSFELVNNILIHSGNQLKPRSMYKFFNAPLHDIKQCKQNLIKDFDDYKKMYNLSQDEINAIIKEIQNEQNQQLTLPNQTISQPFYITQNGGIEGELKPQANGNVCQHQMVLYKGLNEVFNHCKFCGQKE